MPIFAQGRNDRNEVGQMPFYEEITITGDVNTYYPVQFIRIDRGHETKMDEVQIYRTSNDPGPSSHGNTKGGLTSYWHGTDGQWDGGPSYFYCTDISQTYRRTLGAAEDWSGSVDDIFFHLRGGGYTYKFRATCFFRLNVYYQETQLYRRNRDGRTWFAVPRSESEINRLVPLGPDTTSGDLYTSSQWNRTQR